MVRLTSGEYIIGDGGQGVQGLQLGDNVHLMLDRDATLIRMSQSTGEAFATIRNKDQSAENENIRVSGGILKSGQNDDDPPIDMTGRHLGFVNVTHLRVDGIQFRGVYGDWNTSFKNCTDVLISQLDIDSGTEISEDGLHITGGDRYAVDNCNIKCGDDCIALNFGENETGTLTNVVISNCNLWSIQANAVRMYVATESKSGSGNISHVRISNVTAKCGPGDEENAGGINIYDENHSQYITDIAIDNFILDASDSLVEPLIIDGALRVRLSQVVIRLNKYRTRVTASEEVDLRDVVVEMHPSAAASQQCLLVGEFGGCVDVRVLGGIYRNATQHGIQLGTDDYSVIGFQVSGALIENAEDNGLMVRNASSGLVIGNQIAGDFLALQESTDASNNVIIGNWLSTGSSGALFYEGTNTEAIRNVTDAGQEIPDSGGFRQTIDGWTFTNIGANQSAMEMTRAVGRFRAVRPGSVTGVVLTTSNDRTGGTMTATVYKSTGAAGGAGSSISLAATIDGTTIPNRARKTQAMNIPAATFDWGDELYIVIETSGWAVMSGTTDVFCALEIED